jgi:DNA-binding IclR family transcriptional regulator
LTSALEGVRRDGYASEIEESQIGWRGLAVPIFNAAGACSGALSVEMPLTSWNPAVSAKTIALLREAAHAIGAELP